MARECEFKSRSERFLTSSVETLLSISTDAVASGPGHLLPQSIAAAGALASGLVDLLRNKNGFYAFESALHVLPTRSLAGEIGISEWNASALWVQEYQGLADGLLFFAEDIFGGQFAVRDDRIYQFDPETAALEFIADDLEGWASAILSDYEALTGSVLAHEWQQANGPIARGYRLVPKLPFVVGGKFVVENLYPMEAVKGMQFRASVAVQIKNLPDGAPINVKLD